MQVDSSDRIRNLAIAGHNDTGKTTLASALLFTSGAINRMAGCGDHLGAISLKQRQTVVFNDTQ